MSRTNVLIAEGRKLLREGIAAILQHKEVRVVGEAATVELAVKLLQPLSVDVVLLNLNHLSHPSAQAVRAVRSASPHVRVIVIATRVSGPGLKDVLSAGAAGCVTKECSASDLLQAIRSAMNDKPYFCSDVTNLMIKEYTDVAQSLGPREREILCRIASGQNVKEIALELRIGPKTVETHRRRLMAKLELHSVAELIHFAVAEGYVSLKGSGDS